MSAEIGSRLKAARIAAGHDSANLAAAAMRVSPSTYRAHENGQNGFGLEMAETYARHLKISVAYLLTGEGGHGSASSDDIAVIPEISSTKGLSSAGGELFQRKGSAVDGMAVVNTWRFPNEFVTGQLRAQSGSVVIVEVVGDQMHPSYSRGDCVVVDLLEAEIRADGVYVILDDNGAFKVCRIRTMPGRSLTPGQVTLQLVSDNAMYDSTFADAEDIKVVGRVCGAVMKR